MASTSSTLASMALRNWLIRQHQAFTKDFATGSLANWVVCVGNEAGDLDTLASSIGFSFFATLASQANAASNEVRNYVPVQQTKSTDFNLRAENIEVLKLANLLADNQQDDLPMAELICSDHFDFTKFTPYGAQYALLDHNRINSSVFGESAEVVAVIDHHQPEAEDTLYRSANPRLIQVPTGSCASLVTNHFSTDLSDTSIPPEIADLLLSAIAIDTGNFKPIAEDGKATEADMTAKQWLKPRSRFAQKTATSSSLSSPTPSTGFKEFYKQLSKIQKDVSSLSSAQLLRRDYKQSEINGWSLGISSVPTPLEVWIEEKCEGDWSKFLDALKEHAGESKKLDLASVLTGAFKPKNLASGVDPPKPVRRLVLLATGAQRDQISNLVKQEQPNLMAAPSLQLSPFMSIKDPTVIDSWAAQNQTQVYIFNVQNPSATRKQVTPVLLKLVEKLGPKIIS